MPVISAVQTTGYWHTILYYQYYHISDFFNISYSITDIIAIWLVVYLPLWKIWLRQLGWFSIPNWMESQKFMFQTTNQLSNTFPY